MLDNWQTFARHLSNAYEVFAIDLRNHGRSPHSDVFTYQDMSDDIVEFMRDHDIPQATILGHSLGGKVAMQTAWYHPDLVDHLIVVDIAPKAYPPGHDAIIAALQSVDPEKVQSRKGVEEQLMQKLNDPKIVLFLMKNIGRHANNSLFWRMNLPVLAANYENTTTEIQSPVPFTGPALFVRGGRSPYVQDEDWPQIQELFPVAELRTIENAGHWVHADAMEELLEITREFLGR